MNINISPKEIDFKKHLIIDIRTENEINALSLNDVKIAEIDFENDDELKIFNYFKELKTSQDKDLVIMCRSGARSEFLCSFLNQKELLAYNLSGGILAMCDVYPELIK